MKRKFTFELKKNKARATVEIELTDNGVFTASGHTAHYAGQCLEEINKEIKPNKTFDLIYKMWKLHHLNDMHAGTEKQEQALAEKFNGVNANIYTEQCEYLESIGLLVDNGYKFGSGWLKREIPTEDLQLIKSLFEVA
jgi:hypothetical protein